MNNFIFENKTKVYFGKGGVKEYLGSLLGNYGETVMLAYGGGSIKRNGVYDEIMGILNAAGKRIVEFSGIMSNPTYAKVQEGAKLARASAMAENGVLKIGKVTDFQAHQTRIRLFGQEVAEVVGNAVIQRNFPFVQQEADGKRRHGFGHRVHPVRLPLLKGRIVRRRLHFALHVKDEAVHTHTFALQAAHKILHAGCQALVKHGVHSLRRHRLPECTRPSP